ncbi:hypothetical protein HDU93_003810, partial [Gonapodya sp. JEL0774]
PAAEIDSATLSATASATGAKNASSPGEQTELLAPLEKLPGDADRLRAFLVDKYMRRTRSDSPESKTEATAPTTGTPTPHSTTSTRAGLPTLPSSLVAPILLDAVGWIYVIGVAL